MVEFSHVVSVSVDEDIVHLELGHVQHTELFSQFLRQS